MNERDPYMADSDAFSWYMEADPLLRSTVVSVAVLDGPPDMARLLDRAERATRVAPGFRHKVVQAPLRLANPRWVADPEFDLGFHVRHIAAPAPGTLTQVLDYACQTGMAGFDRQRPLWELTVVDGLDGGRAALILKVHHALTDGVGGMELAQALFDIDAHAEPAGPMPEAPQPERLSTVDLVRDAIGHDLGRAARVAPSFVLGNARAACSMLRHPRGGFDRGAGVVRSVARIVRPISTTLSPLMRERHLTWHYDAFTVPLDGLRAAAHSAGMTINDAFLSAVAGGLLRYHEQHGRVAHELRLTMPINLRTADDPIGGNRITLMRFTVPTGVHDPVERMRRIDALSRTARDEPAIPYTNAIAAALNVLPRGVVGGMLKHVDFLASNVPGPRDSVYLVGQELLDWYAFGPTIGAALNTTLVSYNGTCHIGVNVDTGAIPDAATMLECLRAGFAEVAGGQPAVVAADR